jgi:hypothetical protein
MAEIKGAIPQMNNKNKNKGPFKMKGFSGLQN